MLKVIAVPPTDDLIEPRLEAIRGTLARLRRELERVPGYVESSEHVGAATDRRSEVPLLPRAVSAHLHAYFERGLEVVWTAGGRALTRELERGPWVTGGSLWLYEMLSGGEDPDETNLRLWGPTEVPGIGEAIDRIEQTVGEFEATIPIVRRALADASR